MNLSNFLIAFLLTNLLEFIPFYFLIKKPLKTKLFLIILINAITLPLLWLFVLFFYSNYLLALFIAEVAVVIAESLLIKFFLKQEIFHSFKVALLMNALSAVIGFFLF